MEGNVVRVVTVDITELVPSGIELDVVIFHAASQVFRADSLVFFAFLLLPQHEIVHMLLEGVFAISALEESPAWVGDEVQCDFMHFGIGGEGFALFEHFEELGFVDLIFLPFEFVALLA